MSEKTQPGQQYKFRSQLENWARGMDYCALAVPAKITRSLGTKKAVLVMAQLNNSASFKVSLFPAGGGQHYIRIRAKVRKETKLTEGDRVQVRITVLDRADVLIPKDLAAALKAEDMTADFKAVTAGKKNYLIRRIEDAAKPETRVKRIEEAINESRRNPEARADRKARKS